MRLSKEDKYELMRAALKATSLESLRDYLVSVTDAFDDRLPGKTEVPCPRYLEPGEVAVAAANGHSGNGYHEPSLI